MAGKTSLNVGDPEIQSPGAQYQFRADGIGKGEYSFIAIHGRQAGTANTVKTDALGSAALAFSINVSLLPILTI